MVREKSGNFALLKLWTPSYNSRSEPTPAKLKEIPANKVVSAADLEAQWQAEEEEKRREEERKKEAEERAQREQEERIVGRAQDKEYLMIAMRYYYLFSLSVMTPSSDCLIEAVQMRDHNIYLYYW